MEIEVLTTATGVQLPHRNGWMVERAVAHALGLVKCGKVRGLPIPRTNLANPGAKRSVNRYRVQDVKAYIEANTSKPTG